MCAWVCVWRSFCLECVLCLLITPSEGSKSWFSKKKKKCTAIKSVLPKIKLTSPLSWSNLRVADVCLSVYVCDCQLSYFLLGDVCWCVGAGAERGKREAGQNENKGRPDSLINPVCFSSVFPILFIFQPLVHNRKSLGKHIQSHYMLSCHDSSHFGGYILLDMLFILYQQKWADPKYIKRLKRLGLLENHKSWSGNMYQPADLHLNKVFAQNTVNAQVHVGLPVCSLASSTVSNHNGPHARTTRTNRFVLKWLVRVI